MLKKILKIFVDILTVFMFLILIIMIVAKVKMMSSGKEYFEVFGYSIFTVATGSMEPTIKQNDVIIVKETNSYLEDDIVTFKSEKAYITHRIISIRGHDIVTKGDANNTKDLAIKDTDIIGRVVKIFTGIGVWQKVLTEPKIIIMVFITLILFDFAFSYKGIQKKQNIKMVDKIKDIPLEKIRKIEESPKITASEIKELNKKVESVKKGEDVKFDKKEKEFLNYTIRLDLGELQKAIDGEVNGKK